MTDNPLKLRQIHHIEFWVGNARQAAVLLSPAFGFSQFAYAGLETGQRAIGRPTCCARARCASS